MTPTPSPPTPEAQRVFVRLREALEQARQASFSTGLGSDNYSMGDGKEWSLVHSLLSQAEREAGERRAIVWFDPKERLPEEGQECLLVPHDHGGLRTVPVYGPIAWKAPVWLDLWRESEGGSMVSPAVVGLWTPWEPIEPKEPARAVLNPSTAG